MMKIRHRSVFVVMLVSLALTRIASGGRLLEAARAGDDRAVKWELNRGALIEESGPRGATPLIAAAQAGRRSTIELLIRSGADLDARSMGGYTALMAAAANGQTSCLAAIINAGAALETTCDTGGTALAVAAWAGHVGCVRTLLQADAIVETRDATGYTPLMMAAMSDAACVTALAGRKANLRATNRDGETPLSHSRNRMRSCQPTQRSINRRGGTEQHGRPTTFNPGV